MAQFAIVLQCFGNSVAVVIAHAVSANHSLYRVGWNLEKMHRWVSRKLVLAVSEQLKYAPLLLVSPFDAFDVKIGRRNGFSQNMPWSLVRVLNLDQSSEINFSV